MINQLFWKTLILQNLTHTVVRNQCTMSFKSTSSQILTVCGTRQVHSQRFEKTCTARAKIQFFKK
jgi:hypothetical protein